MKTINRYKQWLDKKISRASEDDSYKNYIFVRSAVLLMLDKKRSDNSKYWEEEISGFEYMFDASPLIVSELRKHCFHLTGIRDYDYRNHHSFRSKNFKEKLDYLKKIDKKGLLVPESPKLGGFGYVIKNKIINIDTLKFYEVLIALSKKGILDKSKKRKVVLEIGAGWGGFAYQYKTLFPNTTYIIVDLPPSILFSATYLMTLFPKSKIFVSDGDIETIDNLSIEEWDFIFIPHYLWNKLKFNVPDLVINMVSFQEMTAGQVENYIQKCASWGVKYLYSLNREKSFYNTQIESVSKIIGKYYEVQDISISDLDYNQLSVNREKKLWVKVIGKVMDVLISSRSKKQKNRYRHILANLANDK